MAIGLLVLLVGGIVCGGLLVVGRWFAGMPFGARGLRDAFAFRGAEPWDARLGFARVAGGAFGWYLGAVVLATVGTMMNGEVHVDETSMRVSVGAGGPAERAGIENGDRIVAVGARHVATWDELKSAIANNGSMPTTVTLDRGGSSLDVTVSPEGSPAKIRVAPPVERRPPSFGSALAKGVVLPFGVVTATAHALVRLISGAEKPELSGPVGIVKETGNAAQSGVGAALALVAALASYVFPVIVLAALLSAIARWLRGRGTVSSS